MARYKQLCTLCRKNHVVIERYKQRPICAECEMKDWKEIKSGKYKKILDTPKEIYVKNYFLRNVRGYYETFGKLSEKQVDAFKKAVEKLKNDT